MLEVMIGAIILILIAVTGLGIKLLISKKAEFTGGSCQATYSTNELSDQGISCGCGGTCAGNE